MSWFWVRPGVRRSFRLGVFRRQRREEELADEVRLHVEMRTRQLVARGLPPDEARAAALRRLGASSLEEALARLLPIRIRWERTMRIRSSFDVVRQDVGFALRQLRRNPGFSLAIIGTIAISIGATATMFGIVDRLMLRPPAYVAAPEAVSRVFLTYIGAEGDGRSFSTTPYEFFRLARERSPNIQVSGFHTAPMAVGRGSNALRANVAFVAPGYFRLLGVRPRAGRFLTDQEAHHLQGSRVAVLGYGTWIRRFGGDASALGQTIEIEGMSHTIIGVAPRGFQGSNLRPLELWAPMATLHAMPNERHEFYYGNLMLEALVRPAPGITTVQASTELTHALEAALAEDARATGQELPEVRADLVPLTGAIGGDMERTAEASVALWLAAVSVILLLVACANVASMLVLRAERRVHELAVRLALGVSRMRLSVQVFTECVTIVSLGGLTAVAVTATGGAWLRRMLLPDVAWDGWSSDRRLLLLTIVALVATALVTGLAPVAQAWRATQRGLLAGAAREGGGTTGRRWLQRPLLLAQTALSVVLLVGAGLFLRSLHELRSIDLGMQPDRVLVVSADFANVGWRTGEINAFADRATARLRGVPGVEGVARAESVPFFSLGGGALRIPGRDSLVAALGSSPRKSVVSPEFFDVMGMRVVRGRGITPADGKGAPLVAVINETMAARLWPDASAIGDCFFIGNGPRCFTVVGIVRDAHRFRYDEEPRPYYFIALEQETFAKHPDALLVRTSGDAEHHVARVREALRDVAPELPLLDVITLQSRLDPEARPWELGATVFTIYGAFAMLLSALGLYSAIAYGVVARTRELGLRIAIGARSRQILRLILDEGMRIGVLGLVIGLAITIIAAERLGERLTDLLFRVAPTDSLVLGGVAAVLLLAVLLASLIPAWRATRVDPMIAMRAD